MAFTVEHVESLLQRDLIAELEKVKRYNSKIKQFPYLSQSKLYEHYDLLVERDGSSEKAITLR